MYKAKQEQRTRTTILMYRFGECVIRFSRFFCPVVQVVGDIHGQCCDLLSLLEHTQGEELLWAGPQLLNGDREVGVLQCVCEREREREGERERGRERGRGGEGEGERRCFFCRGKKLVLSTYPIYTCMYMYIHVCPLYLYTRTVYEGFYGSQ